MLIPEQTDDHPVPARPVAGGRWTRRADQDRPHDYWVRHVDKLLDAGLLVFAGWNIDAGRHLAAGIEAASCEGEVRWLAEARQRLALLRAQEVREGPYSTMREDHPLVPRIRASFLANGFAWPPACPTAARQP